MAVTTPYNEAETTEILMAAVAWAGNCSATTRHLRSAGKRCPDNLAERIRGDWAGRYNELREKYSQQLEEQLAHEYRDVSRLATEVQRAGLQRAMEKMHTDNDPSRTAANAATVADKMTGKLLALTGRPTSIREDRNLNEIMRSLVAKGVLQLPDAPQELEATVERSD